MASAAKYRVDVEDESECDRRMREFSNFLWNSQTSQFLGRTGSSWAKIGVFYIIFYGCLAGLCAIVFAALISTLDTSLPTWYYKKESLMLHVPGMVQIPQVIKLDSDPTKSVVAFRNEIRYNMNDNSTYKEHIKVLANLIQEYHNVESQPIHDCVSREKLGDCNFTNLSLGDCDGSDPTFGYGKAAPCFFLKFNKVINWLPESFDVNPDKELLGNRWSTDNMPVTCQGVKPHDQQNLGKVQFFPEHGFPFSCFPYCGNVLSKTYIRPPQMVKFLYPARNVDINIWCRAWASNIWTKHILDEVKQGSPVYRRGSHGSVMFTLHVET